MPSVLQPWVMELCLRAQGTLLTGIRGCDFAPKNPLLPNMEDTVERRLVAFLRYCVLVPADVREIDVPGAWFQSRPPTKWKASQITHYPVHWFAHLMHCFEVIGYLRPEDAPVPLNPMIGNPRMPVTVKLDAIQIYVKLAEHLHLNPENEEQLVKRLTEDRIVAGTVVS